MSWPSKKEISIAAPALTEQWERGSVWLEELMEKVEMPSSSVGKRIILSPVLEHTRDHWVGHQTARLGGQSSSFLHCSWTGLSP